MWPSTPDWRFFPGACWPDFRLGETQTTGGLAALITLLGVDNKTLPFLGFLGFFELLLEGMEAADEELADAGETVANFKGAVLLIPEAAPGTSTAWLR